VSLLFMDVYTELRANISLIHAETGLERYYRGCTTTWQRDGSSRLHNVRDLLFAGCFHFTLSIGTDHPRTWSCRQVRG
jgi:hypothetical protein